MSFARTAFSRSSKTSGQCLNGQPGTGSLPRLPPAGATVQRVRAGETTDIVIALRQGITGLAKDGRVAANTATVLASTGISIVMRKGASTPDVPSPDALKPTLLGARSITYLNPAEWGASGIHFAKVLERLGIANEMKGKTIYTPSTSAVGELFANGEAEFGVLQYQLLFGVPGIEIAGPLPGDL